MADSQVPTYLAKIFHRGAFKGSGVLVRNDRLLTCKHVVGSAKEVEVWLDGHTIGGKVIARDPSNDLALIELDSMAGEPPKWANDAPQGGEITTVGFIQNNFRLVTNRVRAVHVNGEWQVERIEVEGSIPGGMSGGLALRHGTRCIGLISLGGDDTTYSVVAGGAPIAAFLEKQKVALPGWTFPPPPPPQPNTNRYLEWLREETGWVDIRGLEVGSGKAHRFPITALYVQLTTQTEKTPPLEEALANPRLMIQGDAGSGKSTFLRHVANGLCCDPDSGFPIYIRISELDEYIRKEEARNGQHSPKDSCSHRWIAHYLGEQDWGLNQDFFEAKLRDSKTLLMLDGLDETPNLSRREHIAQLFKNAADRYQNCRIAVTTRPQAYSGKARIPGFQDVHIAPLSKEAVEQFLMQWSNCLHPGNEDAAKRRKEQLSAALSAREDIREMANNPLMLTALAVIHWNDRRLPEQRADLYESILLWLARSRERRPGRPGPETCLEYLSLLALGMLTWPGGRAKQIEKGQAVQLLSPMLAPKAALQFLGEEEADSGILISRGDDVLFWHLTFQEYLAARELGGRSEKEQYETVLKEARLYSPEWREAMRLLAAVLRRQGASRANGLFDAILEATGASLGDQARTVALLTVMRDDLRRRDSAGVLTEFQVKNRKYDQLTRRMEDLFKKSPENKGIDAWTRAWASEAWERLDLDTRLRHPSDPDYWVDAGQFRIGRFPVTVWEYSLFVDAGGPAPWDWETQVLRKSRPAVGMTWHDAVAYCEWTEAGCRLPTSDEWYFAAAGKERREYAWGDEKPDDDRANFVYHVGRVTAVGLFPEGNTPEGVADMTGNVWEWTSSKYEAGKEEIVLRGALFVSHVDVLRAAYRSRNHPDGWSVGIGFRCLRE
jgi:hypothetical protein